MRFSNCSATAFAGAAAFAHGLVISNDAVMSFEPYQQIFVLAPSKGCQLNPKDGELTPFRNHVAPFGRSRFVFFVRHFVGGNFLGCYFFRSFLAGFSLFLDSGSTTTNLKKPCF